MVPARRGTALLWRSLHWRTSLYCVLILALLLPAISPVAVQAQTVVDPPVFSVPHGHFSASFQLALSSATGAQIRYTTDYSTPTPTKGTVYTGAITVDKTTVVRAIAYTSTTNKSISVTQTYIFLAQVRTQSNSQSGGWPAFFAPSNSDGGPYPAYYEMAPEIVNNASNSSQLEGALLALPSISLVTDQPNLWDAANGIYVNSNEKGKAWERPLSIEWIAATDAGFSFNAGVRMHGQASRRPHRTPKKTFRVYFRGTDYGVPKLDYKVFADNDAVAKFDKILLRGGGNRSFPYFDRDQRREADYVNDEFARRSFLAMGGLTAHGTYAHVYLNGLYWGVYNLTERVDGDFLVDYMGGLPADYDLIQPDEDLAYQPAADPGTLDAWNALQDSLNVATVNDALYQQVITKLDVVNLADYMILLHYIANTDWPAHNWFTYRKRTGPDTRFRMIPWDSDTALNNLNENMTTQAIADIAGTPARLFYRLMTNPEFRQVVADRFYHHLEQSQGVLTPAQCAQTYSGLTSILDQAIIGESARWGAYARKVYPQISFTETNKALPAYFHSRDMSVTDSDPTGTVPDNQQKTWLQVTQAKLSVYCPQRTGVVIGQYVQNGWYQTAVKAPTFAQEGGAVPQDYALAISNAINNGNGTIYYTVTGVDPRSPGGAVAGGAIDGADLANVPITQVTTVRARVLANGVWSPLHEATFYPPQPLTNLVINEIHYHPAAPVGVDGDVFEFIELYNKGGVPLRVDQMSFSRGFTYHFPANTTIAPGAYFVLASDAAQFQARYGFSPHGVMRGNLSNSGEAIALSDAVGNVIDLVDYLDIAPWPTTPDGTGPSLSLIQPELDNSLATSWAASTAANGTPGQPNGLALINQLPLVNITSPAVNATFALGTPVTIQAEASDSDGTVQQVEFFANNVSLCVVTTAPYSCTFTPAALGTSALTARATDNSGAITTSSEVAINVQAAIQPPVVAITSPAANATFALGTPVTIQAEASDSDGTVQQVEFFANNVSLCVATTAPYSCTFTPALGTSALTARATDNTGTSTTSAEVAINVQAVAQPPVVAITSPAAQATFVKGATVVITADASDPDGNIAQVEFLVDDVVVCTVETLPYTCSFVPTLGSHVLTARALDNQGLSTTSTAVPITVEESSPTLAVVITSPALNSTFAATATVTIQAEVSGDVAERVEFFANAGDPICTDDTAPYTCEWQPTSIGNYILQATAYGANGNAAAPSITVTVVKVGGTDGEDTTKLFLPFVTR